MGMWGGRGSWTSIPSTSSLAFSSPPPLQKLLQFGVVWKMVKEGFYTHLFTGFPLVSHIDQTGWVLPHQYNRQGRFPVAPLKVILHLPFYVLPDLLGDFSTVQYYR
jgi:hypothetical protein